MIRLESIGVHIKLIFMANTYRDVFGYSTIFEHSWREVRRDGIFMEDC